MKAGAMHKDIAELEWILTKTPVENGFSPLRW
jgi:hypothetical protein